MRNKKNIILYGQHKECEDAVQLIQKQSLFKDSVFEFANKREELQKKMTSKKTSLVVVLSNGVAGMEGVYAVRDLDAEHPVFWFSDDIDFALQSHRLECSYFATKPLTEEKISKAIRHCKWTGIRID